MSLSTFATYCPGRSHLDKGLPVQDRASSEKIVMPDGTIVNAIFVSDGHGNECHFRSDKGAELALEAAREAVPYIVELLERRADEIPLQGYIGRGVSNESAITPSDRTPVDPHFETAARMFFLRINTLWAKKVLAHWNSNPTGSSSLAGAARVYGCTILGAFCTRKYWFAFQLGDGAITGIDSDGQPITPIPADSRCLANTTTSLCRQGARDYRYAYGAGHPAALVLCSDGLQDCYESDSALAAVFPGSIAACIYRNGLDAVRRELEEYLPQMSRDFSGDDMAVAFWVDTERLADIMPVINAQNLSQLQANLESVRTELDDCNKSIADLEHQIDSLRCSGLPDETESANIIRKDSVLATLKRRQRQLINELDSLNLDLENLSNETD